jgi:ankyrin repeat protein
MALFYEAASHFDLGGEALEDLIARDESLGRSDSYGKTLLHHACEQGHGSAVTALVEAGVALEAQDRDGRTPLHLACLLAGHPSRARGSDHVLIAKYLQEHQASTGVQVCAYRRFTPRLQLAGTLYTHCALRRGATSPY